MCMWSVFLCGRPQDNDTIVGFPGATPTDENLLVAQCDILIPAAGEKQITANIAKQLKAKVSVCVCVCVCERERERERGREGGREGERIQNCKYLKICLTRKQLSSWYIMYVSMCVS